MDFSVGFVVIVQVLLLLAVLKISYTSMKSRDIWADLDAYHCHWKLNMLVLWTREGI
jgi:hypothetical protein